MTDATHQIQAAAEGVELVDDGRRFTFMGEQFRMADRIGLMPLMKFAMAAKNGLDSDDMEGLAALYTLIRDCVDTTCPQRPVMEDGQPKVDEHGQPVTEDAGPSEWDRFEAHATTMKADGDDFMKVVQDVIEALTARPTQRPAGSSAGPSATSASSKAIRSAPGRAAANVLEFRNAPDQEQVAELTSIDELVQGRSGPVRLTG